MGLLDRLEVVSRERRLKVAELFSTWPKSGSHLCQLERGWRLGRDGVIRARMAAESCWESQVPAFPEGQCVVY